MANSFNAIATNSGSTPSITSGGRTRDNTLGLSGSANGPVKRVAIYDGDTYLGDATLKKGHWSFNTPALVDGTHTLTAKFYSGEVSRISASVQAVIDTRAPAATFAPTLLTDVGPRTLIGSGQSTLDKTLGLSGTAEVGSTVKVYDGKTLMGTAAVTAEGNWHFTTPKLGAGNHAFKAVVSDAAGNQTTVTGPGANLLAIGTVAPTIVTNSGAKPSITSGAVTKDRTPTLTGTALAGTSVDIYDGNTHLGKAVVSSSGTWTYTPPRLADGNHDIKVRFSTAKEIYDVAVNVKVDTVADADLQFLRYIGLPGQVNLNIDPKHIFLGDRLKLTLYSSKDTPDTDKTVQIFDNGRWIGKAQMMPGGYYWDVSTPTLTPGTHQFSASVIDAAGNVAEVLGPKVEVAIGTVNDAIATGSGQSASIASGGVTRDTTLGFSGKAIAGAQVSIYEGATLLARTTTGQDGVWRVTTPALGEGGHTFRFGFANAGMTQVSDKTLRAVIDLAAPDGTFNLALDGADVCSVSGDVLSGTAEEGCAVMLYDGATLLGKADRDGEAWRFDLGSQLQVGRHAFKAQLMDAAGNKTLLTGPTLNCIGNVHPAIATNTGHVARIESGGATSDNTLTLTGAAQVGALVQVYDEGVLLGTAPVDAQGLWRFTTPTLAEGLHSFHAKVTVAGKHADSAEITATIDRHAPAAASISTAITTNLGATPTIRSGARTADHTLGLSGTGEANALIRVYDGNKLLGTTDVDAAGHWVFDTPALASGKHVLKALVTDKAGNTGPDSNTVTAHINPVPPLPAVDHSWSAESGWGEVDALAALRAATGRALPDVLNTPKFRDYLNDGTVLSNMEDAHHYGYTGEGVTVAVIDTGFAATQPALAQAKLSPWAWDFVDDDSVPEDTDGHGSFVASQIVARGDLVDDPRRDYDFVGGAYNVTLMPLRVDYDGYTSLFQAIRHAVDHGADIINMSLMVGTDDQMGAMRSAIEYARDHDVLVVASAGNQIDGANPFYPAAFARELDNVIAVGTLIGHEYANYGNDAGEGPYPFVNASGVNTLGYMPTGSLTWWHGSSFSSPQVAAVAALLLEANPLLSASQMVDLITQTTHAVNNAVW